MSDFVNFKLAQKLKEKGFDEACYNYYEPLKHCLSEIKTQFTNKDGEYYGIITAPTIYQVLKWLREEKDIFIGLEYINQEAYGCTIIRQKTGGLIVKWNWDKFQYAYKNPLTGNTYQQSALAGIEYVLDNLI